MNRNEWFWSIKNANGISMFRKLVNWLRFQFYFFRNQKNNLRYPLISVVASRNGALISTWSEKPNRGKIWISRSCWKNFENAYPILNFTVNYFALRYSWWFERYTSLKLLTFAVYRDAIVNSAPPYREYWTIRNIESITERRIIQSEMSDRICIRRFFFALSENLYFATMVGKSIEMGTYAPLLIKNWTKFRFELKTDCYGITIGS